MDRIVRGPEQGRSQTEVLMGFFSPRTFASVFGGSFLGSILVLVVKGDAPIATFILALMAVVAAFMVGKLTK